MIEAPVLPAREMGEPRTFGNGPRPLPMIVPLTGPPKVQKPRLSGILRNVGLALLALPLLAVGMVLLLNGLVPAILVAGALLLPALLPLMLVILGILLTSNLGG
jgi:hypothetical protein